MPLDVVFFGLLFPLQVAAIDLYPKADSGTDILSSVDFVGADASISALTLAGLGCRVGLVSNNLKDDSTTAKILKRFKTLGIVTSTAALENIDSPFCLTVVDRQGKRTWFTYPSRAAEELLAVDLSLVQGTGLLCVDAYTSTWRAARRAMEYALDCGVPIYINLDEAVPQEDLCRRLERGISVIQMGAIDLSVEQAVEQANRLYEKYCADLCVLTLSGHGVVYTHPSGTYHLPAHPVEVVNTCGAGASFTAGMVYGLRYSWPVDETVKFANALAGLYCSLPVGTAHYTAGEVWDFADRHNLEAVLRGG